jgi:hypothetical protein
VHEQPVDQRSGHRRENLGGRDQNGRCGTGNYGRETTFSLNDVLGNNIPSNVAITGKLTRKTQAGVFVGSDELASGSATLVTETCAP